jgi:hypothetical protein
MKTIINRRDLLLLGAASAVPTGLLLPSLTHAVIPPPPVSPWYLIFIADGIYRISGFYTITLPASAGTCQNYSAAAVSQAIGANLTFTGRWDYSPWNMLAGMSPAKWWEVYDKRVGKYIRIWEYDRFEVIFDDKSRVKVSFRGPNATIRFLPVVGTERLPNGARLNGRIGVDRPADGRKSRDEGGGVSLITPIIPSVGMYAWNYSSQVSPW